jgi:pyruvate ferredoxin oxidoreductase beta subunit
MAQALSIKELAKSEELLVGGHRLCPGCGHSISMRQMLHASPYPVVVSMPTGCFEVCSAVYPYTAWKLPWIHSAFENAAATIAGVEAMYNALKRKGKIDRDIKFVAVGGDGGTYDIGLQSLSGAFERGHNLVYICLDNGAYMNTGTQRSSATPLGADTTTAPVGKKVVGKQQERKNLTKIAAAHDIPYTAQASPSNWKDLTTKFRKALEVKGPAFINVVSPCPRGWRTDASETVNLAEMAVDTCYWPLYEVENGKVTVNYKPKEKLPIIEWLKVQGRFRHLTRPKNEGIVKMFQDKIDRDWEDLLKRAEKE